MSNWKHEEIRGIRDAIESATVQAMSAPRVPGKCQASVSFRRDGYKRLTCLECNFVTEGFNEEVVEAWNSHIIYR
jgi:hypothetical protein